jgi:hypothetical protein
LGSCDVEVQNKTGLITYITVDEKPYKFFGDLWGISCDLKGKRYYINCSNKEPEEIKPKDQGFDEAAEKCRYFIW